MKEEFDKKVYCANDGNLFYGTEVSWKDSVLLMGGIDIAFNFEGNCFVDHIDLSCGTDSKILSVEVLTEICSKPKKNRCV